MAIISSVMLLAVLRSIGNDAEFILVSPIVLPFIKVKRLPFRAAFFKHSKLALIE